MKEKILENKKHGMSAMIIITLLYMLSVFAVIIGALYFPLLTVIGIIWLCIGWIPYLGLKVLKPQEAMVLT
ncbi:MAG: SPFH domain-containing protein, partial [Ruminococcus sp.]